MYILKVGGDEEMKILKEDEEGRVIHMRCPRCRAALISFDSEHPPKEYTNGCSEYKVETFAQYGVEVSKEVERQFKAALSRAVYHYFDGAEHYLVLPRL